MNYKDMSEKSYKKTSIFAGSIIGGILLGVWSFLEASFWFIGPDFLIILFSFVLPKKYKRFILIAIISSLLGGIFYYVLNLFYFDQLSIILFNTPFVVTRNVNFVSNILSSYGVAGALMQSITLIPFKIWTHFIIEFGFSPIIYFILVIISRTFRFLVFAGIASFVARRFPKISRKYFFLFLLIYIILFVGIMIIIEL